MAFAEAQFRLDKRPKGSKCSLRVHLERVWKQRGKKPKQLAEAPEIPPELTYIWNWFYEVCSSEPLTYSELKCWSEITGTRILGWEATLLHSLNTVFRRVLNERISLA